MARLQAHNLKVLWPCELLKSVISVSVSSTSPHFADTPAWHPSDLEGSCDSRMLFFFLWRWKTFKINCMTLWPVCVVGFDFAVTKWWPLPVTESDAMPVSTALIKWQQRGKHRCDLHGKQFPGVGCQGWGKRRCYTGEPIWPWLTAAGVSWAMPPTALCQVSDFPTPSPQSARTTEGNTLQRCHLEHSELNAQSLELKSEHLKERLCNCLCRALQSKGEQKQREKTNSFCL